MKKTAFNKMFNPSRIIVTGAAIRAGDSLLVPFMLSLANNTATMSGQVKDLVYIKQWTEEQWARGAGSLVLQELYKSPVSELPID